MSTYGIHAIQSTSDPRYAEAITLYANNMPAIIRTNTNEIGMWLDTYSQRFHPDRFGVLAFLKNDTVVGYCQYVAIASERLVIVDYICIAKAQRRGIGVYLSFMKLLKERAALEHEGFDIVLEAIDLPIYGRRFEELLKRSGFSTMPYPYRQPALGGVSRELGGKLMIHPARVVVPSEYRRIRNCIKSDHYDRWYAH